MITCAQCGRQVRRDKAVTIEKPVFTNPLERDEVADEQYTRILTREFSYCPSCGKHFRIYQKKTQQNERSRERERNKQFFNRPRPYGPRPAPATQGAPGQNPGTQGIQTAQPAAQIPAQAIQTTAPAPAPAPAVEQPTDVINQEAQDVAQDEEKELEADDAFDEEKSESEKQ